jgi:hypothetical protein
MDCSSGGKPRDATYWALRRNIFLLSGDALGELWPLLRGDYLAGHAIPPIILIAVLVPTMDATGNSMSRRNPGEASLLFGAQCFHWIYACGSPGWNISRR